MVFRVDLGWCLGWFRVVFRVVLRVVFRVVVRVVVFKVFGLSISACHPCARAMLMLSDKDTEYISPTQRN